VMCPSYMATREEEHATRGRANALVKALSSPDPRAATGDERLRPGAGTRGDVVFLADSFTTYTEPAIGRAAIQLLEAAGWRVRLESAGCCGRSSISKGLLDQARSMAEAMVERLAPEAERGVPIVGCEPSCLLTLREEHLSLLPDDPRAQAVAGQARLVEELLVEALDGGALALDPAAPVCGRPILFHGHCHQKALAGTAATMALLRRIPGAEVTELDAGCCGMAGSFGLEAEHYELSMQIGESRLFPALRTAAAGTLVSATGVSCRQQIGHGVGQRAWHPVELVRAALAA